MTRITRNRAHLAETSRHILESLRAQQKADLERPAFGSRSAGDLEASDELDAYDFDDDNESRDIQSSPSAHMDNIAGTAPWRGHSRFDEWVDEMDNDGGSDFPWDDVPQASEFPEPHMSRQPHGRGKHQKPARPARSALFLKESS
jgi:hypothetical protein